MSARDLDHSAGGSQTDREQSARRAGRRIATLGAMLIAFLTLLPEPPDVSESTMSPLCLLCGEFGVVDILLNILLFLPFGLGLRLSGLSRRHARQVALIVTVGVELLQLTLIPGRDATLGDIVTNTLGGWIGILLADSWRAILRPAASTCRVLRYAGGAGFLGLWALTAYLSGTSLPQSRWFGQVPPVNVYGEDFPGSVLSATLNGVALRSGRVRDSKALRDAVVREGVRLEAIAVTSHPTRSPASIVSVFDNNRDEILMLGQDGTDLTFRVRSRVPGYRMRPLTVRITDVLAADDTVRLVAELQDARFLLRATGARSHGERVVQVSPSWGWSLLLPFEYAMGPEGAMLTALWLAGLLAPLAYWAARETPKPVGGVVFLATVVAMALGGVPYAARLAPVHWSEWSGAAVGLLLGFLVGRRSTRPPA